MPTASDRTAALGSVLPEVVPRAVGLPGRPAGGRFRLVDGVRAAVGARGPFRAAARSAPKGRSAGGCRAGAASRCRPRRDRTGRAVRRSARCVSVLVDDAPLVLLLFTVTRGKQSEVREIPLSELEDLCTSWSERLDDLAGSRFTAAPTAGSSGPALAGLAFTLRSAYCVDWSDEREGLKCWIGSGESALS